MSFIKQRRWLELLKRDFLFLFSFEIKQLVVLDCWTDKTSN